MRTINQVVLSLVILAVASTASAQVTTFHYVDFGRGMKPFDANAVFTKYGEFWSFGRNDLEYGRLWDAAKHGDRTLRLGGYVAYIRSTGKWYVLPWVYTGGSLAGGHYDVNLADYVPLNGGHHRLFSDDSSLMWGKNWKAGVSITGSLPEGGGASYGVGPKVEKALTRGGITYVVSSRCEFMRDGQKVGRLQLIVNWGK